MHPAGRLRSPADGVPALARLAGRPAGHARAGAARGARADRARCARAASPSRSATRAPTPRSRGRRSTPARRLVTHVFNAMAPLRHRAPGLVGVALVDDRVRVGVIADGMHVDPLVLELVRRAAGRAGRAGHRRDPGGRGAAGQYEMAGVEIDRDADGSPRTAGRAPRRQHAHARRRGPQLAGDDGGHVGEALRRRRGPRGGRPPPCRHGRRGRPPTSSCSTAPGRSVESCAAAGGSSRRRRPDPRGSARAVRSRSVPGRRSSTTACR